MCIVCRTLFGGPTSGRLPMLWRRRDDHAVYQSLRAEMIESFTRMANARNWALVLFLGVATAVGALLSKGGSAHGVIAVLIGAAAFFTAQFARFAFMACLASSRIGLWLLCLESLNGWHHWNEHHSWHQRIVERGIGSHDDYLVFARRRPPLDWRPKDYIYDFYVWLTAIYTVAVVIVGRNVGPAEGSWPLVGFVVSAGSFLFSVYAVFAENQNTSHLIKIAKAEMASLAPATIPPPELKGWIYWLIGTE
jgi:hypothetical protein